VRGEGPREALTRGAPGPFWGGGLSKNDSVPRMPAVNRGTKLWVAIVAALLAIGLVACGDGNDSTAPATSSQQAQTGGEQNGDDSSAETPAAEDAAEDEQPGPSGDAQDEAIELEEVPSKSFTPKEHDDSGGGSAQFRVKGGDNSVQDFGEEADPAELEAAATALHNFLDARAAEAWDAACSYLSAEVRNGLEELASKASKSEDPSCEALLAALTNPVAISQLREEAAKADVGSVRVEGDRGFVIYRALAGTIMAFPVAKEDGGWKAASLGGTPLN